MLSCYKRPKARSDNSHGSTDRNVDQNVMTEPSNQPFYQRLIAAQADQCAGRKNGNDLA
jgi:hypothetical protein